MNAVERQLRLLNHLTVFSFAVTVHVDRPLDLETLGLAIRHIQRRHPYLNLVATEGPEPGFEWAPERSVRLESRTCAEPSRWREEMERAVSVSQWGAGEPVLRLELLRYPERSELVLVFDHLVADAIGGAWVARDLLVAYEAVVDKREPRQPALPDRIPNLDEVRVVTRGPSRWRQLGRALVKSCASALRLKAAPAADLLPRAGRQVVVRQLRLSAELTTALVQACSREGTTIQGLLCAQMLIGLHSLMRTEARSRRSSTIECGSVHDMRPHFRPPVHREQLGLWLGQVFDVFRIDAATDVWDLARRAKARLSRALDHKETLQLYDLLLHRSFSKAESLLRFFEKPHPAVEVSNVGTWDFASELSSLEVTNVHFCSSLSYIAASRFFLGVYAMTWRGRLTLNLQAMRGAWSAAQLDGLAAGLERRLAELGGPR